MGDPLNVPLTRASASCGVSPACVATACSRVISTMGSWPAMRMSDDSCITSTSAPTSAPQSRGSSARASSGLRLRTATSASCCISTVVMSPPLRLPCSHIVAPCSFIAPTSFSKLDSVASSRANTACGLPPPWA